MADPLLSRRTALTPFWVHLGNWLWRILNFFWLTVVWGLATNVVSTRLTSQADFPADTPVGWMLHHLVLTGLLTSCLLVLTALVGIVRRRAARHLAPISSSFSTQQRIALVRGLLKEYRKRLVQSLAGIPFITIDLLEYPDQAASSGQGGQQKRSYDLSLPPVSSLLQAYDEAGHALLVLGDPGSGKTTLLLDLAMRLLERAERDPTHPIPMIVHLSSWEYKQPFISWLSAQMGLIYGLPAHLSQALLTDQQVLLLLDGLDEVEARRRTACIEAIAAYRQAHFVPLVVCSRREEYLSQAARFPFPGVVALQALPFQRVMDYLEGVGESMQAVHTALQTDTALQALLTTPLMLSVLLHAYANAAADELLVTPSQGQLFEHYFQRMLQVLGKQSPFPPLQAGQWLRWLALHMHQEHLTEIYVEWLQRSWLSPQWASRLERVLIGVIVGGTIGLPTGGIVGLLAWLAGGTGLVPLLGTLAALLVGLCSGFLSSCMPTPLDAYLQIDVQRPLWRATTHSWLPVAMTLLSSGMVVALFCYIYSGVFAGIIFGLLDMFACLLALWFLDTLFRWLIRVLSIRSHNLRLDVIPQDVLFWSWKKSIPGLFAGWAGFLLLWPLYGLLTGSVAGLLSALAVGCASGLSSQQFPVDRRVVPNQGILRTGHNALCIGLLIWLNFGLLFGLVFGLFFGLTSGVIFGFSGGFCLGLFFALNFGGSDYCGHYFLRYLLWRSGTMPWRLVYFLDTAVSCNLLQRVGGGYRFIHPLFQGYLVSRDTLSPVQTRPSLDEKIHSSGSLSDKES